MLARDLRPQQQGRPLFITFDEAARLLSVSSRTIRRAVETRCPDSLRVRPAVRVNRDELLAWAK